MNIFIVFLTIKYMRKNASIPLRMRSLSASSQKRFQSLEHQLWSSMEYSIAYRAQRNTVNTRIFYCLLNKFKKKRGRMWAFPWECVVSLSILAEAVPISWISALIFHGILHRILSAAEYRKHSNILLSSEQIKKKTRKNMSIPLRMRSLSQHPRRSGSNFLNISFDLPWDSVISNFEKLK